MNDGASLAIQADMTNEELGKAIETCVHLYSERIQTTVDEGGDPFAPLSVNGVATATDVMILTRNMLKVFEIAPFELSMLTFGGIR